MHIKDKKKSSMFSLPRNKHVVNTFSLYFSITYRSLDMEHGKNTDSWVLLLGPLVVLGEAQESERITCFE